MMAFGGAWDAAAGAGAAQVFTPRPTLFCTELCPPVSRVICTSPGHICQVSQDLAGGCPPVPGAAVQEQAAAVLHASFACRRFVVCQPSVPCSFNVFLCRSVTGFRDFLRPQGSPPAFGVAWCHGLPASLYRACAHGVSLALSKPARKPRSRFELQNEAWNRRRGKRGLFPLSRLCRQRRCSPRGPSRSGRAGTSRSAEKIGLRGNRAV
jgi:hypothetical protein